MLAAMLRQKIAKEGEKFFAGGGLSRDDSGHRGGRRDVGDWRREVLAELSEQFKSISRVNQSWIFILRERKILAVLGYENHFLFGPVGIADLVEHIRILCCQIR